MLSRHFDYSRDGDKKKRRVSVPGMLRGTQKYKKKEGKCVCVCVYGEFFMTEYITYVKPAGGMNYRVVG